MQGKLSPVVVNSYQPLREIVCEVLRDAIRGGILKTGEWLKENDLADELLVSRTPVREAIRKLEQEGYVVTVPRRGAYVASVSIRDINEIFEIRAALEALACELAAERITDEEQERLERLLVAIGRAIVREPKVLLMDEPFGALDPLVRADLQRELRDLQRRLGTTILFVTHDVDEAFLLGDQVAVLRTGGVLAQVGTPEELLSKPADEFVADFVGADASRRQLRSVERNGSRVVVDANGRPLGTLREDGGGAADGESS